MDDLNQIKRDKLLDLIRRAIANPHNAEEVADEIAIDWFPMFLVKPDSSVEIKVGSGKKR